MCRLEPVCVNVHPSCQAFQTAFRRLQDRKHIPLPWHDYYAQVSEVIWCDFSIMALIVMEKGCSNCNLVSLCCRGLLGLFMGLPHRNMQTVRVCERDWIVPLLKGDTVLFLPAIVFFWPHCCHFSSQHHLYGAARISPHPHTQFIFDFWLALMPMSD